MIIKLELLLTFRKLRRGELMCYEGRLINLLEMQRSKREHHGYTSLSMCGASILFYYFF